MRVLGWAAGTLLAVVCVAVALVVIPPIILFSIIFARRSYR